MDKNNIDELIGLSALSDRHEDTIMLLINKHTSKPLGKQKLLEELNRVMAMYKKQPWSEDDLDISLNLLTKQGLILTPGK